MKELKKTIYHRLVKLVRNTDTKGPKFKKRKRIEHTWYVHRKILLMFHHVWTFMTITIVLLFTLSIDRWEGECNRPSCSSLSANWVGAFVPLFPCQTGPLSPRLGHSYATSFQVPLLGNLNLGGTCIMFFLVSSILFHSFIHSLRSIWFDFQWPI